MQNRTHNLNELRIENVGEQVALCGWLENVRRVSKNLAFCVLRDFYGKTQVVIESEELMAVVDQINCESTIAVKGVVRERSSKNPNMATGDIEVVPDTIEVLGKCIHNELPFEINRSTESDENLRLKYRFLDLRNPKVKDKIILRSKVVNALRKAMCDEGFLEITTPILTCSSPEGARDYLVPSRIHPGQFYALPQAPQQFKQILMTSGFDKYFQIAPCFRDEDARADRSPGEFYQLDLEMSWASQDDVFATMEKVLPPIFVEYGAYDRTPSGAFPRIPYVEAMDKYGSDKPDLRIDLVAKDASCLLSGCGFEPFVDATIKAVVIDQFSETRKFIEKNVAEVEAQTSQKAYWFRVDETGALVGGISKFLVDVKDTVLDTLGIQPNSLVVLSANKNKLVAQKTAGVIIKTFGYALPNHVDLEQYNFCWIVDFPMYEIGEESGELEFCHNPFSMPQGGLDAILEAKGDVEKLLKINAYQYDIVCNGIELSSGAVRNHSPEIMIEAFKVVGLGEEDVKAKFPAMYNAFCYGAPPHAGIAPGVDRIVMLLAGVDTIREVIPFPMNKRAQDIMMGAPSTVTEKQLREVHIKVVED